MRLEIAAQSCIGKVRQNNEDNLLVVKSYLPVNNRGMQKPLLKSLPCHKPLCFGVFDGMGGLSAGEEASFCMAKLASQQFQKLKSKGIQAALREICKQANEAVCAQMQREKLKMGTTAALLAVLGSTAYLCNIGDSPIFRLRKGELEQLSMEHTERATYERVRGQPASPGKKFCLTQHIGIAPEELQLEPYLHRETVEPGDEFLICSDGLTDMLELSQLRQYMNSVPTAGEQLALMLNAALEAGGKDNTTLIVIRVLP